MTSKTALKYDRSGAKVYDAIRYFLDENGVISQGITKADVHVFHRPDNTNLNFRLSVKERKDLHMAQITLHDVPTSKGNACDDALVKQMLDTVQMVGYSCFHIYSP